MRKNKSELSGSALRERIKTIIRERGIMQKEFAASLGVSANYIYLITSGKKSSISVKSK
jgi:transcriptional regulator with XRE-family HTH domain